MKDEELFSHLMAEITGRFEDLAEKATVLPSPGRATEASLAQLVSDAQQACRLTDAAQVLATAPQPEI